MVRAIISWGIAVMLLMTCGVSKATNCTLSATVAEQDTFSGTAVVLGSAGYIWSNGNSVIGPAGVGTNIANASYTFASQTMAGDFAIRVQSTSVDASGVVGSTSIMIKTAATEFVRITLYKLGTSQVYYGVSKTVTNMATGVETSTVTVNQTAVTLPYWFQLQRVGGVFTVYTSPDNVTYTQQGSTFTLPTDTDPTLVGVEAESGVIDASQSGEGTFSNISLFTYNGSTWTQIPTQLAVATVGDSRSYHGFVTPTFVPGTLFFGAATINTSTSTNGLCGGSAATGYAPNQIKFYDNGVVVWASQSGSESAPATPSCNNGCQITTVNPGSGLTSFTLVHGHTYTFVSTTSPVVGNGSPGTTATVNIAKTIQINP